MISSFSFSGFLAAIKRPVRYGLLAGLLMGVLSFFMPNQYKSEARLLPAGDSKMSGLGGMAAAAAAAMGVALPGGEGADAAYVDILKSRRIQKQLAEDTYRFRTRAFLFAPWKTREETFIHYLKAKNLDSAVASVGKMLSVNRDLKTKLITVSAETPSPELSQQLVRKAVAGLETFIQTKGRTKGGQKAQFTAERLLEAQEAATRAERELAAFLDVHRNYVTSNDPNVRLKGAKLESAVKLRQQLMTTLALNQEQALLEEKNDMPMLNVLDEGDLPLDKSAPKRSMLVVLAGLLGFMGALAWGNRHWIKTKLMEEPEAESLSERCCQEQA